MRWGENRVLLCKRMCEDISSFTSSSSSFAPAPHVLWLTPRCPSAVVPPRDEGWRKEEDRSVRQWMAIVNLRSRGTWIINSLDLNRTSECSSSYYPLHPFLYYFYLFSFNNTTSGRQQAGGNRTRRFKWKKPMCVSRSGFYFVRWTVIGLHWH